MLANRPETSIVMLPTSSPVTVMTETFTTAHMVVHLAVDVPDAVTLPVLVEFADPQNPRISYSVTKYARYLQREGHASYETIHKSVRALGKLLDYYLLVYKSRSLSTGEIKNLLDDFLFAFDNGSVLGWGNAHTNEFVVARTAVADYVKFVQAYSASWMLDEAEHHFINECRQAFVGATHAHESLLFHTKKRQAKKRGRRKAAIGLRQYKPFPPNLVDELIQETPNVRDKILFASSAYGGRRLSEYLNLFLEDVEVIGTELTMVLRHPTKAPMTWRNVTGSKVKGNRREYLKSMFNRLPRVDHGAKSSKAGWKGIKFEDLANLSSNVYFIRGAGVELAKLHRQYLHEFLPKLPKGKHPYYLVSEAGNPLTIKAAEKQFRLACRRLEKKHGISLKGYGLHSLRHYYGFFHADVLKTDLLFLQLYMGHTRLSSTAVYAHISPATARQALIEVEQRAKHEGRIEVDGEERKRIQKQFEVCPIPPITLDLARLGTTPFGELDTRKMTRKL